MISHTGQKTLASIMIALSLSTISSSVAVAASSQVTHEAKKEKSMQSLSSGRIDITFVSQGYKLKGHLYTPQNFDLNQKYPTVIFSPPFNQVKEQMGAVYGKKFAEKGYVFLAFDHLGYGDSEGKPRNAENPFVKMETIRDAISYLRTLNYVDREHFYGMAACASGNYLPTVAVTDKRMKAIATVSGILSSRMRLLDKMTPEQMSQVFSFANEAHQKEYETGVTEYYDGLGFEKVDPKNLPDSLLIKDGYDYYMTDRAGVENFDYHTPKTFMEVSPLVDALTFAPYLNTPYLGIYGERSMDDNGPTTIAFYEKTTEPKKLYEVKGASHVDLYDKEQYVNEAVEQMVNWFSQY